MSPTPLPTVDPTTLPSDAVLVDVREDDEWVAGHAPGALHVPMSEFLTRLDMVPVDRPLVVLCRSGHRSAQVTAYLLNSGYRAANLDGGMLAWQAAGRPMRSESGAPPAVV